MQPYWYLGFLGFIGFLDLPGIIHAFDGTGHWYDALGMLWFLWFLDFLPEDTPRT